MDREKLFQPDKTEIGKIDVKLTVILLRIVAAIAMCVCVPMFSVPAPYSLVLLFAAGLAAGADLLAAGISGFFHEDYFNRNTLLLLIFVVSYIIGVGYEGTLLLIITQIGLIGTDFVQRKAREHVLSLTGLSFKQAHVFRGGLLVDNFLNEIYPGDEILVRAGEFFPVDCIVIEGNTTLSPCLLDIKSDEQAANIGDDVLAGMMNVGVDVRCEVVSDGSSTASDILETLAHEGRFEQPLLVRFFQPMMMGFSVLVGLMLALYADVDAFEAVHRALAVVTLSGALPAFSGVADIRFAARAGLACRGAVFASGEVFDELLECETAIFCAEGILTEGKLQVSEIYTNRLDGDTFLKIAAHAMAYSNDPSAEAIVEAYGDEIEFELIQDFKEIPGCGVMVTFNGVQVVLGTQVLMATVKGMLPEKMVSDEQIMFMLIGKQYAGYIVLSDPIRKDISDTAASVKNAGVTNMEFVTSYSGETAQEISDQTGILQFKASQSCDERMLYLEQVREGTSGKMMYLFDSHYAGEEHSAADFDVNVGGNTSELLNGKSDLVAPTGRAGAVFEAISAVKSTMQMCNASVIFMFAVKLLMIVLAGVGLVTVWFAATAECIAALFVKVFSTAAFEEKTLHFFRTKSNY